MSLLQLRDAGYATRGRTLLAAVNLTLAPGTFKVVLGPNGAGKSTLLRLCCGELARTAGAALWEGADLAATPAWRLAAARAVLPQASSPGFPFTVGEVARMGAETVGRRLPRRTIAAIVRDSLERADMAHLAGQRYDTLSGGERQRAHFARALAQLAAGRAAADGPLRQALFLDEPTASLDIRHQLLLLREARRLADDGLAVMAALHDLAPAACADDILLLRAGRPLALGAPDEVLAPALLRAAFGVKTETLRGRDGARAFIHRLP
ncbi:ATP-binding cassette domain-containing protein [Camelimonas abortus]|uniref:ATP-binding cassette domain-containing protein n=1 Tax=Camelimonas abortus TaxID=1017184 RepID=A0ABV7LAM6_9HYPH